MNTATFIISTTIFVIWVTLVYRFYKHNSVVNLGSISLTSKTDKVLKQEAERIKKRNSTAKFLKNMRNLVNNISFFRETNRKMEDINYYAKRLNFVWNENTLSAQDLLAIRASLSLVYLVIACILIIFKSLYLLPLLAFYKFPCTIFDFFCEQEIKDRNALLLEDFRDFYAEFFYNYRHKANRGVKITEVAMRFYNRANKETKLLIDNLRADSIQSEEYALDQMKDLFRVVKIHRMADQIKMIIMGKSLNTDAMEGFKTEIEAEFRDKKKKELEWKKLKANAVQAIAWAILTELVMAFSISGMLQRS